MYKQYSIQKIINFLQDFTCSTEEQLQVLFGLEKYDFKSILYSGFVSKKDNIYVYNGASIDNKMIAALDVLKKYKKKYTEFYKGFPPIYISFLADNLLYHVIVTDLEDQEGIINILNSEPMNYRYADKYIILFKDMSMYEKIAIEKPYLYCTYPPVKGVNIAKTSI